MKLLGLAVAVFAMGCGGDGVSIKGNDPVADGRAVTNAICEWQAECGSWEIDCSGSPLQCTATPKPVTFQECEAEELQDITGDFTCAGDLSASEKQLVEKCVNNVVSSDCITQAEMDAYLDAIERGEEPMPPSDTPPECDTLENIFERCE